MISFFSFWKDSRGQDLIEYLSLLALIAMVSAALFIGSGRNIKEIWQTDRQDTAAHFVCADGSVPQKAADDTAACADGTAALSLDTTKGIDGFTEVMLWIGAGTVLVLAVNRRRPNRN